MQYYTEKATKNLYDVPILPPENIRLDPRGRARPGVRGLQAMKRIH